MGIFIIEFIGFKKEKRSHMADSPKGGKKYRKFGYVKLKR